MADIRAAASGDFSNTATWVGGVIPGSGDVAFANTFTVTISDTRTVQAISNASGTGITVGGTFSLLNGCDLTCSNANGVLNGATSAVCIQTPSLGLGSSARVTANYSGNANAQYAVVSFSTAGTLTWAGNISMNGAFNNLRSFEVSGSGTLIFTGNITGSSNIGTTGMTITGAATVSMSGTITGGSSTNSHGLSITGAANVTMNSGMVIGGANATAAGINNSGTGTLTVSGTCQSSANAPAIGQGSTAQVTRLSGPFLLGASGNINPVQAQSWRWAPTQVPTYMEVSTSGGSTKRNLYTADNMPSGGYPVVANVRQSTVYGPSSEFTGTLSVPAASSVALGVATDNTTGTAILTAASVRTAVGMASANLDTQLAVKATVDQVSSIVQGATTA